MLISDAGVLNNSFKGIRIKPCMIRDSYTMRSVRHADVFTFGYNLKADFAEGPDSPFSRDIGKKHG